MLAFVIGICFSLEAQDKKGKEKEPKEEVRDSKLGIDFDLLGRANKRETTIIDHVEIELDADKYALALQNKDSYGFTGLRLFNDDRSSMGYMAKVNENYISGILILEPNDFVIGNLNADLVFAVGLEEAMRITSSGDVGIGTGTPTEALDVNGKLAITEDANDEMIIINGDTYGHFSGDQDFGSGGYNWIVASKEQELETAGIYGDGDAVTIWSAGDGAPGQPAAFLYICDEDAFNVTDTDPYNNGAVKAYIDVGGMWIASDRNRKENIKTYPGNALSKLAQLNTYSYRYKMNAEEKAKAAESRDGLAQNREVIGIIAQELEKVIPQAVNKNDDGEYFVNYNQVTPVLLQAVKELSEENAMLKERLNKMEAAIEDLKN